MEKITEYKAISAFGTKELNTLVNESIKEGWKPQGGVSLAFVNITTGTQSAMGLHFVQAMIR